MNLLGFVVRQDQGVLQLLRRGEFGDAHFEDARDILLVRMISIRGDHGRDAELVIGQIDDERWLWPSDLRVFVRSEFVE